MSARLRSSQSSRHRGVWWLVSAIICIDKKTRARLLIELTADLGVPGHHLRALATLADAIEEAEGQPPIVNAAGAIAAVRGQAGLPIEHFGPLALAARAAGLAAQIATSKRSSQHPSSDTPAAESLPLATS